MDSRIDFLAKVQPLLLRPGEADLFWATFTNDVVEAKRIAKTHPTLTIYTISTWGDEYWAHRGLRTVNRLGFVFGSQDLGASFKSLLWRESDAE